MKKFISLLLITTLVLSLSSVALASNETTLTTTVPPAEYTLQIPADQEIVFGTTRTEIGMVKVVDSNGFAEGKDLKVTITHDDFKSDGVSTTIPYYTCGKYEITVSSGTGYVPQDRYMTLTENVPLIFTGMSTGSVGDAKAYKSSGDYEYITALTIEATSKNWGKALAGVYTSVITFTAEVVADTN